MLSDSTVLARVLLAALAVASVAPSYAEAQTGSAQARDTVLAQGVSAAGEPPSLFRYIILRDGRIQIGYLGPAPTDGGVPRPPDAPPAVDSVIVPRDLYTLIYERLGEAHALEYPDRVFGIHFEDERLRLQFDQGLSIWAALGAALLLLLTGGGAVGLALTRREHQRRELEAQARQRALHAREAERSRIAREIHDGPLQDVHALRLHSGGPLPEPVSEEASRIARELRAIAEGLRPPALGRFGLAAALSAHANRVKERHPGVLIGLDLDEDGTGPDALPDVVRSALFRIAQESISNAIEHGDASHVHVRLGLPSGNGPIELEIRDNGTGLPWEDTQPDFAALADDGHFGLVGMYERVAAIGGTLTLDHEGLDETGVRIHVSLPDVRKPSPPRRRMGRFLRLLSAKPS